MKYATFFLVTCIFSCIAMQIHAQRLVRMSPGSEVYRQPRASSALDDARVYQMRFLNNRNQTDLYHFSLNGFIKSFDADESDFYVQLEEITHRQTQPKMKVTEKKVKAKDGSETIQTKYTVRSSVICDYKMVVFSKQFDTLLVAQKSGEESYCSSTCKTSKQAWCSFNATNPPFSSHSKDICEYLIAVFNENFRDSYKTVPFKIYNSNKTDYVMFRKGYTLLDQGFRIHAVKGNEPAVLDLLEQSEFFFEAFINKVTELPLNSVRKNKLRHAIYFNLAQIHFLRREYGLMYNSLNKANSFLPAVKAYNKKMKRIAFTCAQRLQLI